MEFLKLISALLRIKNNKANWDKNKQILSCLCYEFIKKYLELMNILTLSYLTGTKFSYPESFSKFSCIFCIL